jgi:hypothetical protein
MEAQSITEIPRVSGVFLFPCIHDYVDTSVVRDGTRLSQTFLAQYQFLLMWYTTFPQKRFLTFQ